VIMDSGIIILILVLLNLSAMMFCFKDFKNARDGKKPVPIYQVYLMSSLFAALGVLLCVIATGYRVKNKVFILLHIFILAIQIVGLVFLIPVLIS